MLPADWERTTIFTFIYVLDNTTVCYLQTERGQQYLPVFCKVRWQHVLNDLASLKLVEEDKLFNLGLLIIQV
jgi:hypothetical protein